jgi:signal transduction histidine kinase
MSDIVWVVNPNRDSLYDLIIRLKDVYSDFLSALGISLKIQNVDKLKNIKINMELRQNLYLIFKEGINNSIKHSRCKNITLKVNTKGDFILVVLVDNGIGMEEIKRSGNGIRNMEQRAAATGGNLTVSSELNKGTTITFKGSIKGKRDIKRVLAPFIQKTN